MGAYGGTVQAGRAYLGNRRCETITANDINGECVVDFKRICMMSTHWRENGMGSRYINDEKVVGTLALTLVALAVNRLKYIIVQKRVTKLSVIVSVLRYAGRRTCAGSYRANKGESLDLLEIEACCVTSWVKGMA